jgi:hypothetical protein
MLNRLRIRGHFHWWSEKMFKQAMIAVAAFAAASTISAPAEAHRDRTRASVVVTYGSPGYHGGYYDPYYRPVYYQPVHYRPRYRSNYYYYEPHYRYRPRHYRYDRYYRPHKRYWKKRHWRRYHDRW